jgi:hypothetical protein
MSSQRRLRCAATLAIVLFSLGVSACNTSAGDLTRVGHCNTVSTQMPPVAASETDVFTDSNGLDQDLDGDGPTPAPTAAQPGAALLAALLPNEAPPTEPVPTLSCKPGQ